MDRKKQNKKRNGLSVAERRFIGFHSIEGMICPRKIAPSLAAANVQNYYSPCQKLLHQHNHYCVAYVQNWVANCSATPDKLFPGIGGATKLMMIRQQLRLFAFIRQYKDIKGSQAKIKKQSMILFWLLNITIWCQHVHRLELQKVFYYFFVLRIYQLD